MTDEVAALVLRDNYDQARALGNARAQARVAAAGAPSDDQPTWSGTGSSTASWRRCPATRSCRTAGEAGDGLTVPEFAVLLAYVKIVLEREVLASELPDDPWTVDVLADYFPTPLRERVRASG